MICTIENRRDLGGLQAMDGRAIRPGCLIRSAHLFHAEETDLAGVGAVIDLRTPGERREAPDRTWGRPYLPLPIFDEMTAGISHEQRAESQGVPDLELLYSRLVTSCTGAFRSVLLAIMGHDYSTGAILWHCTEGKDRCGLTAAIVLEALGVGREAILEDYLKTNEVNLPKATAIRERLAPARGEDFANRVYRVYLADERYLRAAWSAMGSGYLHDRLGVSNDELDAFRSKVLY